MTTEGNRYDTTRPAKAERISGVRPPDKLDKAIGFLRSKLTNSDRKVCELVDELEEAEEAKATLFRAKDTMFKAGQLSVDDSRQPLIWHLPRNNEPA